MRTGLRVIAGRLRGRRLKSPDWEGLRPSSDRLRETLFNVLGSRVVAARVLDGFAGTGAVGIEAISRGAAGVWFVERDRRAVALIAGNLARCGIETGYTMAHAPLVAGLARLPAGVLFDVALLDPPYGDATGDMLETAAARLAPDGLLVLEHAARAPAPEAAGLTVTRVIVAGDSALTFMRPSAAPGPPEESRNMPQHPPNGRLALCPGTFDPLTNGHVDIILRSAHLFERILVAVLVNADKTPLFSPEERVDAIREVFREYPNIEVEQFDGLLVDYARRQRASAIVRGLRAVSDFEYEFQMALMNRKLRHTVETVFMMPHERYTYIASRLIKEVASLGAPITGMVPPPVEERLAQKFSKPR
jgi:pantetheine-phosphate adenylyltransferase